MTLLMRKKICSILFPKSCHWSMLFWGPSIITNPSVKDDSRDLWVRNLFKNLAMTLQKDIVCHTNLQITNQWNSYCAPVDASQLPGIIDFQALSFFSWQLISICQYRKCFHGTWKLTFGEIAVLSSRMVLLCVSFVLPSKKKTEFKSPWDR